QRLAGHLEVLLTAVATDPHQRIGVLPLLTDAEHTQLAAFATGDPLQVNDPDLACPLWPHSDRTAIVAPDGTLTHTQLAARVNTLARWLHHQHGIRPEHTVALPMPRTLDLIIAILAVWHTGAACLPLNPDDPPTRRQQLLATTPPTLTLTHLPHLDNDHAGDPPPRPHPDNTAVLIYTSGSTGHPKPVAITHTNLAHTRTTWAHLYHHQPHTWLSTTPHTTDVFIGDILRTIGHAGTLILAHTPHLAIDPPQLHHALHHHQVTAWETTPHTLHLLTTHTTQPLPHLQLLAIATDPYPTHLHPTVQTLAPHAHIITAYGLTETTIDTTTHHTNPNPTGTHYPIGAPLPTTTCRLLDHHGQPAPIGIPATIHITGPTLTRGYPTRPDLTAERFTADPYGPPGTRLYHTGDTATWTPTGQLHYHGRTDHQLNHAGHRIEPTEIETLLTTHPHITHAAITQHHHTLHAWLVPTVPDNIHTWTRHHLPTHLTPTHYHPLDTLPHTPTGKLDRHALQHLPTPTPTNPTTQPPHTPTEHTLAHIWHTHLHQPTINRHDNYFHLGGHSLLATQTINHINTTFHTNLPLRTLFTHPTLTDLATTIEEAVLADIEALPEEQIQTLLAPGREADA
ncbi:MAG TPA: non-ribosomal peptide synthetase, partial [Planosporangium sp.]|nr:non-ribosomal peptide synthetase [Planosporangium sp.]